MRGIARRAMCARATRTVSGDDWRDSASDDGDDDDNNNDGGGAYQTDTGGGLYWRAVMVVNGPLDTDQLCTNCDEQRWRSCGVREHAR